MNEDRSPEHDPSGIAGYASLGCLCAALGLIFWGAFQLDLPLQQFTRSLHILWLERTGDGLGYLGSGTGLVTVSVLLLAIGYLLKHQPLQRSGVESLIAHGAVALVAQVMKHLVGRPRPRLMRNGEFLTGPSFESGLDSFPSGHASASFAVAAVVARSLPRWGWLVYGVAGLITVSRVVRGSHFVSDATAGVVLGVLVGSVVAHPLRDWRRSLAGGLTNVTPYLAGAFALLSTFCQPASDEELQVMMLWAGSAAIAFGAGNRWGSTLRSQPSALLPYSAPAIGIGLALTTGAWLVVLVAGLVIVARRLLGGGAQPVTVVGTGPRAILAEAVVTALLILAILSLQGMKGLLLPS